MLAHGAGVPTGILNAEDMVSKETGLPSSKSFPVQTAVGLSSGLNFGFVFGADVAVVKKDMVLVCDLLKRILNF